MELKRAKTICVLFLGVFLVLMLAMGITSDTAYGYAAIGVMGIYGIFHYCYWRCPKCGKNMGPLWVKCCPECGEKIN